MRFTELTNIQGEPFLFSAIRSGNVYMVRWWLQIMNANPNTIYNEHTALTLAIRYKQPLVIETVVRSTSLDLTLHQTRFVPECTAVTLCSPRTASLILSHPTARINITNHVGIPLLYLCIYQGQTALVKLLLDKGATPILRDPTDMANNTLWAAILTYMPNGTFPTLCQYPALSELKDTWLGPQTRYSETLLEIAVKKNDYMSVKYLFSIHPWTQTTTYTGERFLWIASRNNNTLLFLLLIRYEAALKIQSFWKQRKNQSLNPLECLF
jgi:hypothetical protein